MAMAALPPVTTYSFRHTNNIFAASPPQTTVEAQLAAIEARLRAANAAFHGRRYQRAIDLYHETDDLIYKLNHPGSVVAPSGAASSARASTPQFVDPLLSQCAEWLNLLPVRQPGQGPRPRTADAPTPACEQATERLGLTSTPLLAPGASAAAADWQLSQALARQGNDRASTFFANRARSAAPSVAAAFDAAAGRTSTSAPAESATASSVSGATTATNGTATTTVAAPAGSLPPALQLERTYTTRVNGQTVSFSWNAGDAPPLDQIKAQLYTSRIAATDLSSPISQPQQPSDFALQILHVRYYEIPLGLAECHHALQDFETAEDFYFTVADYCFFNTQIEAIYLWHRLATLYLDWGNARYLDDDPQAASTIYQNVLLLNNTAPNSRLYTHQSLVSGSNLGKTVIANLAHVGTLNVDPEVAAPIVDLSRQLTKIKGGLDYWGHATASVPIWTFEYLQSVAVDFTQLAISAERDVISFWERSDMARLTRQQIAQGVAQSEAEQRAAELQANAADAEVAVYVDGNELAIARQAIALANANEYRKLSKQWIVQQALSSQMSGGDEADPDLLNSYADSIAGGWNPSDPNASKAAAAGLSASRLHREYELDSLGRQAVEAHLAADQAASELGAATARRDAAKAAVDVAALRAKAARQNLATFDSQTFTADVWHRMGDAMWRLYQRYLGMAITTARLMQRSYNFETDQSLSIIKNDYSTGAVKGLLGADTLMADIKTFTYDLITSRKTKAQPIRQTISLAERYPFAFERQLRPTGIMELETRIDDFDALYPGTYAGRIEAVEVEVEGIVPVRGISGTLTNSGISSYRLPSALWTSGNASGLKHRLQSRETLVLSDYSLRRDGLQVPDDQRTTRIFQGAGLASSWRLELPPAVNDIDYGALTDVRLTFYYKARFDPELHDRVLAQLATRPGINVRQRGIPVRWLYPDAFFHFQDTGELSITLSQADFPVNECNPILTDISLIVATDKTISTTGLRVAVATPGKAEAIGVADKTGLIDATTSGNTGDILPSKFPLLTGGSALGTYTLAMRPADNPSLFVNGKLMLAPIVNIGLILGYQFTPRGTAGSVGTPPGPSTPPSGPVLM
jgi:hypothetical protein